MWFCHSQAWNQWNVSLALSGAVRVFRLLSQVTLLRFVFVPHIFANKISLREMRFDAVVTDIVSPHYPTGQLYSIVSSMSKEHVLSAGFDINTPDNFGRTCLHAAASGG